MSSLERFKCKARREQYSPKRAGDKKMKRNITQYDFLRAFQEWTANDRHLSFSREALLEIYDILTDYEDSTGQELELDVVAICCEFTEYDNLDEACKYYEIDDLTDDNYNEMTDDEKFDALNYNVRAWEIFNTERILVQQ